MGDSAFAVLFIQDFGYLFYTVVWLYLYNVVFVVVSFLVELHGSLLIP